MTIWNFSVLYKTKQKKKHLSHKSGKNQNGAQEFGETLIKCGATRVLHAYVILRFDVIILVVLYVRESAPREPVAGIRAERFHADLDVLTYVPLRAVAHTCVQLLRLGDRAHAGYHPAAAIRALFSSEQFSAVI